VRIAARFSGRSFEGVGLEQRLVELATPLLAPLGER
jgi:hypothetical protein